MHRLVYYLAGGGDGAQRRCVAWFGGAAHLLPRQAGAYGKRLTPWPARCRRRHPEVEDVESSGMAQAALLNDTAVLERLLLSGRVDANAPDHGERPLVLCVLRATEPCCTELLIAAGADPAVTDANGLTPLHWLAQRAAQADVLQPLAALLLRAGCNLEAREQLYGASALAWSGWHGSTGAADALVRLGAELDSFDLYGGTPLRWALQNGHAETVTVLRAAAAAESPPPRWSPATHADVAAFRRALQVKHAPRLESAARVRAAWAVRLVAHAFDETLGVPLPGPVAARLAEVLMTHMFTLWPPATRPRV